jgi:hypothetical protein
MSTFMFPTLDTGNEVDTYFKRLYFENEHQLAKEKSKTHILYFDFILSLHLRGFHGIVSLCYSIKREERR